MEEVIYVLNILVLGIELIVIFSRKISLKIYNSIPFFKRLTFLEDVKESKSIKEVWFWSNLIITGFLYDFLYKLNLQQPLEFILSVLIGTIFILAMVIRDGTFYTEKVES